MIFICVLEKKYFIQKIEFPLSRDNKSKNQPILLKFGRDIAFLYFRNDKVSSYPPENGFSRSLESRFLSVLKNDAQCSHFRPMGPFSLDIVNLISYIRYFVKKWRFFY